MIAKNTRIFLAATSILFFSAAALWFLVVGPSRLWIPEDFHYTAQIISQDNFYNEEEQRFSGEQRSATQYEYSVQAVNEDVLTIQNTFDVKTLEGDPIVFVEQEYGVNKKTGAHVEGAGNTNRNGYLFAPHHLEEGEPFTYWHVNYDGPANMEYVGTEYIRGLKVYQYETRYAGVEIDQTENLSFLPGVPEEKHVLLEPHLQIWVEPITGYMVKYTDKTTAYYHDAQTGEKLYPWNQFSNTYTHTSVLAHVEDAAQLKAQWQRHTHTIPLVLVLCGIVFLLIAFVQRKYVVVISVVVFIAVGIGTFIYNRTTEEEPDARFSIGVALWVDSDEFSAVVDGFTNALEEQDWNFDEDIHMTVLRADGDEEQQKKNVQQFLEDDVDVIFSLTTNGTLITKELVEQYAQENNVDPTPIVFGVVTYPVQAGIIESFDNSRNNIVGTRNYVSAEDQYQNFQQVVPNHSVIGFLHRTSEPNSNIQFEEMKSVIEQNGAQIRDLSAENAEELAERLAVLDADIDALYAACDTLLQSEDGNAVYQQFLENSAFPDFSCIEGATSQSSLMSTAADFYDVGELAGEKASFILQGVAPQSLRTDTVARPRILVNTKRLERLGIILPQQFSAQVDEFVD